MKFQPNRCYKSNDEIMTPLKMAERIVKHFNCQSGFCNYYERKKESEVNENN